MSTVSHGVDMLVLERRGVVTLGQRRAFALVPAPGVGMVDLAQGAALASIGDTSPEGCLLAGLAHPVAGGAVRTLAHTPQRHLSGADVEGHPYRKGDRTAVESWLDASCSHLPAWFDERIDEYAASGDESWIVVDADRPLGIVRWRDELRPGVRGCCEALRREGIATVLMYDGDVTMGASLAVHAGIDHVLATDDPVLHGEGVAVCARTRPVLGGGLYLGDDLAKATATIMRSRRPYGRWLPRLLRHL
ncbi:haloacid dehalogenase-like hydrolase [Luteibacter rhizovicinus]|uniref:Haloacid dehalogenase-like hydrolase n=1 Tax=Luteibacter rhizovicinus TaxID=242606 RepID=A0A4R3YLP2_9GAMM|nr:HAD family hydrolase [Luteibacter rhizovicinus]TCV93206.1 haloacid dehalogenase-like hydrolase [Luteibacter rhizovicinus]